MALRVFVFFEHKLFHEFYFKLGLVVHSERGLVARVISRLGANKKESVKCSLTREHKNISIS